MTQKTQIEKERERERVVALEVYNKNRVVEQIN